MNHVGCKRDQVVIYAGFGVSRGSLEALINLCTTLFPLHVLLLVDHRDLCESFWEERTALLIMPGGRDLLYHRFLGGKGTQKIRDFVEKGGLFLGVCAGAYFGAQEVVFEPFSVHEVCGRRDLAFFPGSAIGSIYQGFSYRAEIGARIVPIGVGMLEVPLYYHGGCYFDRPERFCDHVRVIGRYMDRGHRAALVDCRVKLGRAILSGVHIEHPSILIERESSRLRVGHAEEMRRNFVGNLLRIP